MGRIHRAEPRLCPGAVRQVPPRPVVGRRRHARAVPAVDAARRPTSTRRRRSRANRCTRRSARSTWRSRSAATVTSRRRLDPLGLRKPLGDPSLSPENYGITDEDLRALPASLISSPLCRGRHVHVRRGRGAPPHLLLDHRLRLRARVRARGAALAAPRGGVRPVPRAGRSDRSAGAARSADAGRGVRAVPASQPSPARRASRSRAST